MISLGADSIRALVFLGLSIVMFIISKMVKDITTPYGINEELGKANLAVSLSLAGYMFSTMIILMAAFFGPDKGLWVDVQNFLIYAVLGIVLLNVARFINDYVILRKFSNTKEMVEDRNAGTGAVEFGTYVASGLIVAGSIYGEGGGILSALAFFALGQVTLVLFSFLYDWITPFDLHHEIEQDNVAAGVAFGGTTIALGIILFNGLLGDFTTWRDSLLSFGINAVVAFIFLPLVRLTLDKVLLTRINLNQAISQDRNIAVSVVEMAFAVSFALILFSTVDFDIAF